MSLGPPCCIGCGFYIGALDFLPETMGYFSITKLEDMGVNSLWIARYRLSESLFPYKGYDLIFLQ